MLIDSRTHGGTGLAFRKIGVYMPLYCGIFMRETLLLWRGKRRLPKGRPVPITGTPTFSYPAAHDWRHDDRILIV